MPPRSPAFTLSTFLLAASPAAAADPPPLLTFHEGDALRFEVRFDKIGRFEATRARKGAPKLALYLEGDHAEAYDDFTVRYFGRRMWVSACGRVLGQRVIVTANIPGRVEVLFMNTPQSRHYLASLDAGRCLPE